MVKRKGIADIDLKDSLRVGRVGRNSFQKPQIRIYLTPCVPLSFKGEGGKLKRGAKPLLDSLDRGSACEGLCQVVE